MLGLGIARNKDSMFFEDRAFLLFFSLTLLKFFTVKALPSLLPPPPPPQDSDIWAPGRISEDETHVVVEGLGFTGVVACLSSLWSSTIKVPEHTLVGRRKKRKDKTIKKVPLDMFTQR